MTIIIMPQYIILYLSLGSIVFCSIIKCGLFIKAYYKQKEISNIIKQYQALEPSLDKNADLENEKHTIINQYQVIDQNSDEFPFIEANVSNIKNQFIDYSSDIYEVV